MSVLYDCKPTTTESWSLRLPKWVELPLYLSALFVLIVLVCCGFLWPIWSDDARNRRATMASLLDWRV
jgi:hypothetical protein